MNPAHYSRVIFSFQTDNNFLPNEDLVSWTATYPGRIFHHDDITDNVGTAGQNFLRVIDYPGDSGDQVFVQTNRADSVLGVTDQLTMQLVLGSSEVWDGTQSQIIPSELDLADWEFTKVFAVQYASSIEGGSGQVSLVYGDIDTLTILEMPGDSDDNPILPVPDPGPACPESGCVLFNLLGDTVFRGVNTPLWFDPEIVIGYDHEVLSGPNISGVELPSGFGDDMYDVYYYDTTQNLFVIAATVGDMEYLDLTTFDVSGFERTRVLGIEEEEGLDPDNPLAFPTGLTFLSEGDLQLTMTAITLVPEPSSLALLTCLAVCCLTTRRKKR